MKFDLLHRLVTLAVVWTGFVALFLSSEFGIAVVLPSMAIPLAGVFFWKVLRRRNSGRFAGVVALLAGLGAGYMAWASTDYLLWAITFAVFVACLKSLFLRTSGDFMQMYALSFLSVMAAAVVNPGMSFGVAMLPYTVLLVFGLLMTNLRRSIERTVKSAVSSQSDADAFMSRRGVIRRGFVLMTMGLTIVVFLSSTAFFFLFPRMGLGFFARQQRKATAVTGFSEQVNLGDFGNIIDDEQVVLRVVPHGGKKFDDLRLPLRMKGQSLDEYDGRSWRKTTSMTGFLNSAPDGMLRLPGSRVRGPVSQTRDVYMEPMSGSVHVLFGEPEIKAFSPPMSQLDALRPDKWRFHTDFAGDVTMTGPDSSAIVYTVESEPPPDNPAALRQAGTDYHERIRGLYLSLPEQKPGVVELAKQLADGRDNPWDIAVAIESALSSRWDYSLNSTHGSEDPLADFLLVNRTGHCEYFASAMVVMLRVLGIPARIVNGFYGGVMNDYGNYAALRRSDAHSWVEVFFPGHGWATFDPTPSEALDMRRSGGLLAGLRSAIDAMRLTWYRWVVEYDLEKQIEFIGRALQLRKSTSFGDKVDKNYIRRILRKLRDLPWEWIFGIPIGLVVLGVGIRRLVPRLKLRNGLPGSVPGVMHYRRMRKMLARHGLKRGTGETQIEFAARAARHWPQARPAMGMIARAYAAVLSGRPPPSTDVELDAAIDQVSSALSSGRRR